MAIDGTPNGETLTGTTNAETINGFGGNDILSGLGGADILNGGSGLDTAWYRDSLTGVVVNLLTGTATGGDAQGDTFNSIEWLAGSDFDDTLTGDNASNRINGFDGSDILNGRGGADILIGGSGADILNGGSGSDTANYGLSASAVNVNLGTGVTTGGDAHGDTYSSIENIYGSRHDDELIGDGQNNRLNGGLGNDTIRGLGGNDLLVGGRGADILDGGDGIDTVSYRHADLQTIVNPRNGQMLGAAQGDTLIDIENVIGTRFNDSLILGDGQNRIFGLSGNDFIDGGNGNDFIGGGAGGDFIHGGTGSDTANYKSSDAGITVDFEASIVTGGHATGDTLSNIENVFGSQFADSLAGNFLENHFEGREGTDRLVGRAGSDTLTGGADTDTFVFEELADHVSNTTSSNTIARYAGATFDTITDFTRGEDVLEFAAAEFSGSVVVTNQISALGLATANDTAFALVGSDLFYVSYDSVADFNAGTATLTHLSVLNGITTLDATDFAFV